MEVWCAHALGSGHRTNIGAAVLLVGDPVRDDFDADMYSRHDEQYKSTLISKFSKIICIQSLVGPAKCGDKSFLCNTYEIRVSSQLLSRSFEFL